jgi:hypothetical protein
MRILADLPDEDISWLDRKAAESGRSRAALVREAIAIYRARAGEGDLEQYFGLWKDRADIGDGLAYQRRIRTEWDRDWDQDPE